MGHSKPSTVASTWPTMTTTTSMASLSAPSGPLSTSNILSMPKPPAHRLPYKMWAIHHPTPVPLSSLVHSDWSSEEDWDSTKQKERERISKIIRKKKRKIAEEERKKKYEERTLSSRSCAPDLLNDEPNLPLTNPPAPAPEKNKKTQEKQNDHVTDYYLPSPIYVASYEGEAPNLVNNLVPKPNPQTTKERYKQDRREQDNCR